MASEPTGTGPAELTPFQTARVERPGGVHIAYRRFGSPADPVVLAVHGFASTSGRTWETSGWVRALIAARRQVVTVDLRGHGDSDRPTDAAAYDIGTLVEDLVAVLDQVPGPADYLGYSLGSRLGWELAVRHPSRLRSLSLGGLPASEPLVAFDVDAASACLARGEPVADPFTRGFLAMIEAVPENDPAALVALAAGVQTGERASSAPTVPTLLVTGGDDDVAADGVGLVDRVPNGRFVGIPGRTHVNTLTARAFKDAVVEFLATLN